MYGRVEGEGRVEPLVSFRGKNTLMNRRENMLPARVDPCTERTTVWRQLTEFMRTTPEKELARSYRMVQGYLAHKKLPTPLGPP